DPTHETGSFAGEADAKKPINSEGGVAYPGVSIVPVANAADCLGKAGRRGRNDRAGGLERQELQSQCRSVHLLPPASMVRAGREPFSPESNGRLKELLGFILSRCTRKAL